MSEKPIHIPVLLSETIESLDIKPDGIYVDCTTGFAGHSSSISACNSSRVFSLGFVMVGRSFLLIIIEKGQSIFSAALVK